MTRQVLDVTTLARSSGWFHPPGQYALNNWLGWSVSGAGDVNGDGLADLIVGANELALMTAGGEAYIVYGKAGTDGMQFGMIITFPGRILL